MEVPRSLSPTGGHAAAVSVAVLAGADVSKEVCEVLGGLVCLYLDCNLVDAVDLSPSTNILT